MQGAHRNGIGGSKKEAVPGPQSHDLQLSFLVRDPHLKRPREPQPGAFRFLGAP
jgi:hypothetical protein